LDVDKNRFLVEDKRVELKENRMTIAQVRNLLDEILQISDSANGDGREQVNQIRITV
jgi:hypothetical protein